MKAVILALGLLMAFTSLARANNLALGDSLALGFGRATHLPTRAISGIGSCAILRMTPRGHLHYVLLSAGTNDWSNPACIGAVRARLHADKVRWVVPVNSARRNVLKVAARYGDELLYYTPGRGRVWPHPPRYFAVPE